MEEKFRQDESAPALQEERPGQSGEACPAVSVVVPVYNASPYLRQCLSSIQAQTEREIEIICVDDGSTDDSRDIIGEYLSGDARFRLIRQKNQYAGVARNHGLSKARGEYVIFWDADDFFEPEALAHLLKCAREQQAQIVVCNANEYSEATKSFSEPCYIHPEGLPDARPFSREEAGDRIFEFTSNTPWNKLYLRSFLQEQALSFEPIRQFNDAYFVMSAFVHAKRITILDETLIHYRVFGGSSLMDTAGRDPLATYRTFSKFQQEYEKELSGDAALKKAFQNKALAGFMRVLNMQSNYEGYAAILDCLRDQAVSEFGFDSLRTEDCFRGWMLEQLQKILTLSNTDYMAWKLYRRYIETKSQRVKIEKRDKKILGQNRKIDGQNEKIARLQEALKSAKATIKEQDRLLQSRPVKAALKARELLGKK